MTIRQIEVREKHELDNQNYTNVIKYLLTCCGTYAMDPVLRNFPDINVILNKIDPINIDIKTDNQLNNFKVSTIFKLLSKTAI